VEGFGRRKYKADYVKFLIYAHASCDETKEHLKLLYETESLKDRNAYLGLLDKCEVLSKMMNRVIGVVQASSFKLQATSIPPKADPPPAGNLKPETCSLKLEA